MTAMTRYPINPVLGVNFDEESDTQKHPLGMEVDDNLGGTMRYCLNGAAALTAYEIGIIDEDNTFTVAKNADTNGALPAKAGIPQIAVTASYYFWAWVKGTGAKVSAALNCAADVRLYLTSTDGVVDDASSSVDLVEGLRLDETITTAQAAACSSSGYLSIMGQDD